MKISILGLGYVGAVSSACLAGEGHEVVGIDINQEKVNSLQLGKSSIVEPGLPELIRNTASNGTLKATTVLEEAIMQTDLSLICVGTPSQANGALDLTYVKRVSEQIGDALKNKKSFHSVVVRSTVLPGTTEEIIVPILEKTSGKQAGVDFGVAFNPEFLREGSAIFDFENPPRSVIGEFDQITANKLEEIYGHLDAPLVRVPIRVAEAVKYADNAFHALKVVFGNEIGAFCKAYGVDSHKVMDIFVLDTKLNLSPYYLKPGAAFGGSCLPKDVRALLHAAKMKDVSIPVLEAIIPSNEIQKQRAIQLVSQSGNKKVGILGLSFKENTDDLRESPSVYLTETLIGKGFEVRIFDPGLHTGNLIGANRTFIQNYLPHIDKLLVASLDEVLNASETVVISTRDKAFRDVGKKLTSDHILIDLVRLFDEPNPKLQGEYNGIAW